MEVVVKMDRNGRLLVPKEVRKRIGGDTFLLDVETRKHTERMILTKIPSPREMWGALPNIDLEKHKREHARER